MKEINCLNCKKMVMCRWKAGIEEIIHSFAGTNLEKHNKPEVYEKGYCFFSEFCGYYEEK